MEELLQTVLTAVESWFHKCASEINWSSTTNDIDGFSINVPYSTFIFRKLFHILIFCVS